MVTEKRTGHLAALLTILIWGTTFISTKILLTDFQPVEILFFRFIMGYLVLLIAYPHHIKRLSRKQEMIFAAAFVWACYSILTKEIGSFGLPVILTTRRTFFYGILFMTPTLFLFDFQLDVLRFADMKNLLNILYLGIGASALCFVTWNYAVKVLGAVKTSIYIYMVPVITVITSMLVLKETVTFLSITGTILALAGLFLSEYNRTGSKEEN